MSTPVVIVGAGGHAVVIADALMASGTTVAGFIDAQPVAPGATLLGVPIWSEAVFLAVHDPTSFAMANGIGGVGRPHARPSLPTARRAVQERLEAMGWRFVQVMHPRAVVSPMADLAPDVQVLAGAIIQPLSRLARGCIINTAAVVEHHVRMGPFCHVAPGAIVCGDVVLGSDVHVGASAVIRQGQTLGDGVVVGVGAAVTRDWSHGTVSGVPARLHGATAS